MTNKEERNFGLVMRDLFRAGLVQDYDVVTELYERGWTLIDKIKAEGGTLPTDECSDSA